MTLTLDPRLPVLWRTPHTVQVGVDDPPVVLTNVATAHERMLAGLAIGLTPQGLALIGSESGLSVVEVADFESAILPALATPRLALSASVDVDGFGLTADRLEGRLREAGLHPRRVDPHRELPHVDGSSEPASPSQPEFAIIIGDYVLHPERRGRWLRRDIPHLPLVYGDTSVTIGPFIEPGAGPCLYCLELHRTDADPAWPALAAQLLAQSSSAQTPFIASEAATIATRMVLRRVGSGAADSSVSVTLDVESGTCRQQTWSTHPDCACAGLSIVSEQYRPETARESSAKSVGHATATTKDAAACVPA